METKTKLMVCGALLAVMGVAGAQTRTLTINAVQVGDSVTGGRVAFLTDGGCTLQAEISRAALAFVEQPAPQDGRAAICAAARNAFNASARLSFGVSDGGRP